MKLPATPTSAPVRIPSKLRAVLRPGFVLYFRQCARERASERERIYNSPSASALISFSFSSP